MADNLIPEKPQETPFPAPRAKKAVQKTPTQPTSAPAEAEEEVQQPVQQPQALQTSASRGFGGPVGTTPGSGGLVRILLAVVVLVAIALLVMHFMAGSSGSQLQSILSARQFNSTAYAQLVSQDINSSPTFQVAYSGSIFVNGSNSSLLGGITLTIPFTAEYMKYNNDSRISLSAKHILVLGNLSVVEVTEGKTLAYGCLSSSMYGGSGYKCQEASTADLLNATGLSSLRNMETVNISVKSVTQSSFNGQSCYLVTGTVKSSPNRQQGGSVSSFLGSNSTTTNFTACMSEQYGIPLNGTMAGKADGATSIITFEETSIGQSVAQSDVTQLPGPVVNNTSFAGGFDGSYGGNGASTTINYGYNYTTINVSPTTTTNATYTQGNTGSYPSCDNYTLTANNSNSATGTCYWTGGFMDVGCGLGIQNGAFYSFSSLSTGTQYFTGQAVSCGAVCSEPRYVPSGSYSLLVTAGSGYGTCLGNDYATMQSA